MAQLLRRGGPSSKPWDLWLIFVLSLSVYTFVSDYCIVSSSSWISASAMCRCEMCYLGLVSGRLSWKEGERERERGREMYKPATDSQTWLRLLMLPNCTIYPKRIGIVTATAISVLGSALSDVCWSMHPSTLSLSLSLIPYMLMMYLYIYQYLYI